MTTYLNYNFEQDKSNRPEKADNIKIWVPISASLSKTTIIPGLYEIRTNQEPYHCFFSIWGDFEKITFLEVKFVSNGNREIEIPVSIEEINKNRKPSGDGRFIFSLSEKIPLSIVWANIETLVIETKFKSSSKEGAKDFKYSKKFLKEYSQKTGNRIWFGLMGI